MKLEFCIATGADRYYKFFRKIHFVLRVKDLFVKIATLLTLLEIYSHFELFLQLDVVQEEGQLHDSNLTRSTTANTRSSIVLMDNNPERAASILQVFNC